ncbi:MAG: hypothetical protein V1726_01255 [Methanobacteriota archaeon]
MKLVLVICLFLVVCISFEVLCVDAHEPVSNEFGRCQCWFSKDNITWEEATVSCVSLQRGEPFYVKACLEAKQDLRVMSLALSGVDSGSSDFIQLRGPGVFSTFYHLWSPRKNDSLTLWWMMRVNPSTGWVNGSSPLNVDVGFTDDAGTHMLPPFTIVNVYIVDEMWQNTITENAAGFSVVDSWVVPGFSIVFMSVTVGVVLGFVLVKKKRIL